MRLGRCQWARELLNRSRSQSISRQSSAEPPEHPGTIHPQELPLSQPTSSCVSPTQHTSGPTAQNDASSGLDGTDRDEKNLAPPWQGWKLDSNFLSDLHKWNNLHKDDKLPAVLAKVNGILESKPLEAALEFIPDVPFPAKSFVKAMTSLFLLGSKIPQAKQDVYNFSNQIVVDITNLAVVFGETGGGKLSQKLWEDLQATRDLVNDICKWAYDGLESKNALSAMEEIKEVKEKLNDARSKFNQIAIIRAFGALDTVIDSIEALRRQNLINTRLESIKKTLGERVIPQVKYDSKTQKKREYHEETRKGVLNDIGLWARTHSDTMNCWWITGRPAVGKSTIGAKVAETFEDEKCLYAQYFATRNIPATTDPENILPTMALQLAENSPLAATVIEDMLKTTPLSVVKKISDRQARVLLLEPLQTIAQYVPKVVVVIDGVDELANAEPSVLSEITSVLCSIMSELPTNVKILIFSRPEQWITVKIPRHIKRLDLATDNSKDDVDRLVRAKLRELAVFHEWNDWPSEDQVSRLCWLSDGHLGWAMTALRWIASQVKWEGSARRDEVIEEVTQLGMGELDELYAFIFQRILPPQEPARKRYLRGLKTVLGCLLVLQEPLDIGTISTLLSLDNFDVLYCMKRISSIITEGTESMTERTVPQLHKSIVDFLLSSRAHPDLRIDPTEHHHSLTTCCFEVIQKRLFFNIGHSTTSHHLDKTSSISQIITYPCLWFADHLKYGGERATLVPEVEKFMKTRFLQWLEVLSLQRWINSAVSRLEILELQIKDKDSALAIFIGDAIKFVKKFKRVMDRNAAHIYISALPFAPSHSLISQHYLPQYPHTVVVKGGPHTWDELEEQPVSVERACISLDGTRIAAVFRDETLCVYDTTTGEVILSPFKVGEIPRSMILSRDGKLVALGGQALRLWNVQTGEKVESFNIIVYSLAFSPDGTCIAAGCEGMDDGDGRLGNYNIRVINLELAKKPYFHGHIFVSFGGKDIRLLKGEVRPSPYEGHVSHVNSVAYSADGKQIASTSSDNKGTMRIWNVSTGSRRTFRPISHWDQPVTFSPDGTQIASGLRLFNLYTGSYTHKTPSNSKAVYSPAFSADGRFLVSASLSEMCYIWDASANQIILRLVGHTLHVTSITFFADGKRIMSASKDGTIRVWDVESPERREMDGWRMEMNQDGFWFLGPAGEHLLWTPFTFRHPRNTLVIGKCPTIDFSKFVHGDEWVKCREPL